ncbi:hypothetical protein SAY87_000072 [Trapa incisa]|uniref:PHD finger family protein n=1 Tax=Trapa incisa TaxID=236973 RepID=A0AAN7J9K7_9MYRT|nr:hypothetical protein SAY87_000072 [Trapa incisa]
MRRGLLRWLLWVMTGGRCRMGMGGAYCPGAQERTIPISVASQMPGLDVDFFSQARKALSECSPCDIPEDGSAPSTTLYTLPGELAALLKNPESKKRNKKSNSSGDNKKKKSAKPGERSRGHGIWDETEDYFRDLTLDDIDTLVKVASGSPLAAVETLLLQHFGSINAGDDAEGSNRGNDGRTVHRDDEEEGMELDSAEEERVCSISGSCSHSVEWLLGCRDKIYLTTERPSKRRKLLGSDADLEKVFVASPRESNSTLCDFCCRGAGDTDLNPLIVCSSCGVVVHKKCYGVIGEAHESWLCSRCKQTVNQGGLGYSCVLCSKQEGALKPLQSVVGTSGHQEFAHLFCSQWMPEVYIEDLARMEPILGMEKLAETRRKLVCNICKIKCGVCLSCSHGTCRTSFHPTCAREARHRMEIWGRFGDDNVELQAFCLKHSEIQPCSRQLGSDSSVITASTDSYTNSSPPGKLPVKESQSSKRSCRNGDEATMQLQEPDNSVVSDCSELQDVLLNSRISTFGCNSESVVWHLGCMDKVKLSKEEEAKVSEPLSLLPLLKKLIDGGNVSLKNVASDVGMSFDSLSAKLAVDHLVPDLRCNLVKWLQSHAYLASVSSDAAHPVAVKSVPSRRRTKGNMRIMNDDGNLLSSDHTPAVDNINHALEEADESAQLLLTDVLDKKTEAFNFDDSLAGDSKVHNDSNDREASHGIISAITMEDYNLYSKQLECKIPDCGSGGRDIDQLVKARQMGILELSPDDEVEGEIIYSQHRLLQNITVRRPASDTLIRSVGKSLPQELDAAHSKNWDAILINRYLHERREAKKQGRKERKHKEAQAVLAAATAAAAASSRSSSFRKDLIDESVSQMLLNINITRGGPSSSEICSQAGMQRGYERNTDVDKEYTKSCDICNRPEKIMNPILVCSSCKVAVHLDCYRNVRESTGPWYCELCEQLKCSGVLDAEFWDKFSSAAECVICGGTTGAFRQSISGQWIHSFCAEWIFEGTFRRGQVDPVLVMDTISIGMDECNICHHKYGICLKCNYGHCHTTFHPSCARSNGLFMIMKPIGGKLAHKAYCMKHSPEQKAKVESERYGPEELKSIKQIRVELEKLRLLCERIVKREKVKREIVVCTHEILSMKRNMAARLALAQSPFFLPSADLSSDSATTTTTSVNNRSGSEATAVKRLDDMTVDSSLAGKRRPKVTFSIGGNSHDHGTDIISRHHDKKSTHKPGGKASVPGKTISKRPPTPDVSHNLFDDSERRLQHKKWTETLEKELVMTSDQADLKNKLLPKGYAYVPSDRIILPKDKWTNCEPCPGETLEDGG